MQVGRRLTQVTILSGSVVRIWGTLENILERNEGSLSKSDRMMRVVRVELEAGKHLVGKHLLLYFPEGLIQKQHPKDALLCRAW